MTGWIIPLIGIVAALCLIILVSELQAKAFKKNKPHILFTLWPWDKK